MNATDSLGRATFHHIASQRDVRPTDREFRWLKHIERHGPQSSEFLFELTRDTHSCKDTALRAMQKLRAGGYLRLPPQQRQTAKADFNPYVYDIGRKAVEHLVALGSAEPTIRPSGPWWHAYRIATFTSSLDIMAARGGVEFIPGHRILAIRNSSLAIPLARGRVIPDQLFALKYPSGYRAILLEIDRGTEPIASPAARRSLTLAVDQYREVFARELHRGHYGLRANTLVHWVFEDPVRAARFREIVRQRAGCQAGQITVKSWTNAQTRWEGYQTFQRAPWQKADGGEMQLL